LTTVHARIVDNKHNVLVDRIELDCLPKPGETFVLRVKDANRPTAFTVSGFSHRLIDLAVSTEGPSHVVIIELTPVPKPTKCERPEGCTMAADVQCLEDDAPRLYGKWLCYHHNDELTDALHKRRSEGKGKQ
jgi:hypothetical protein